MAINSDNYKCLSCGYRTHVAVGALGHKAPECPYCGKPLVPID